MGETPQELCRVRIRFKADSDPDLDPFSFPQCGSGFDSTDPGFAITMDVKFYISSFPLVKF